MLGRMVGRWSGMPSRRPQRRAFLAVPLLTAAVVLLQQVPAHADPDDTLKLRASRSGKCMDNPNNSPSNGTIMDIYTCLHPIPGNEQWGIQHLFEDWANIRNGASGKCLTVKGAVHTNNAYIVQWRCTDGANEEWEPRSSPNGGGAYIFVSRNTTNKCITVQNDGVDNESKLIQYDCNGGLNQDWYIDS